MKWKLAVSLAAFALFAHPMANALPIQYQGNIVIGGPAVTGSVSGFGYISDEAANVDFWTFSGVAGQSVLIRGTRLDSRLDPSLNLYFGTTTADQSTFVHDSNFGGLQLLATGDDEIDVPGPFGDPALLFELTRTGTYTIVLGGFASDADPAGGLPYRLAVSVPEPATLPLVLLAVAGLGFVLRRKQSV
jgi:PEP-CTERM motif-containing protein